MQHVYEVGVALSNIVVENHLQHPLVKITLRRHFWLTVKLDYNANHAR
jgi:hypothetical protein